MRALRYSLRTLARNPAFSSVIVLLLAFGIGANTLIFTAVDVLLLRDLPVDHPEQLVRLEEIHPSGFRSVTPEFPDNYRDQLREQLKCFQEVFSSIDLDMSFRGAGRVESVTAQAVSGNYYRALGVQALLGRTIVDDDDRVGGPYPVVLSYAFWQRALAGRPSVVRETIRLRDVPFTIVGVMPRTFHDLTVEGGPDVTMPGAAFYTWTSNPSATGAPAQIFGRLRRGVSVAQASAEVETLFPSMVDAWGQRTGGEYFTPREKQDWVASEKTNRAVLAPLSLGTSSLRKQFALAVKVLMGAVGALLLLVCANIAGLMLARGEAARKEIAVRLSLGATRLTVASQLVTDALVVSILGAAAAILIARWGGPLLLSFLPSRRPLALELVPDARVLAFALGACVVTALAMSIMPALHLFKADLTGLMGRGGPRYRRSRAGIALVALQVGLATILLMGGGALVRTLSRLRNADLGVDRHNLIVMVVSPQMAGIRRSESIDVVRQIFGRAKTLDGVEGVSLTNYPQMRGIGTKTTVAPAGTVARTPDFLNTTFCSVSIGHFENAGMHILSGRDFLQSDINATKPAHVIVSKSFAKRFFPNADPIGKTFLSMVNGSSPPNNEIVGVVSDIRFRSMREEAPPIYYQPVEPSVTSMMAFVLYVRTRTAPGPVIASLRNVLASVGPGLAPSEAATMEQDIETSLWQERLIAALASVFAAASAVLVAIGLYGMLSYSIARRTREIGIRIALGARPVHLIEMISADVTLSVAPGLILGIAVYAFCARAISPVLYGVRPMDAISVSFSLALIPLVAAIAGFVPTRRAVAIEPSEALRQE